MFIYCYFYTPDNEYSSLDDIDQIISVEIHSQEDDPELYTLVQNYMVHGPCEILRRESPCMKEGIAEMKKLICYL